MTTKVTKYSLMADSDVIRKLSKRETTVVRNNLINTRTSKRLITQRFVDKVKDAETEKEVVKLTLKFQEDYAMLTEREDNYKKVARKYKINTKEGV